jgi:hypothetical protein
MTTVQVIRDRDRWADWAVIVVVAIALILGLVLQEATLSQTDSFSGSGVSGRYPANWVRETGEDPLLRVHDPRGGEFNTVLEVRSRPLAAEANPILVLDALAYERSAQVVAYKTLSTDQVSISGKAVTRRSFTYVYQDRNPYVDRLPVVVQGQDLALPDEDGRVVVVTLLASADDFAANYRYFRALVESLVF